MPGSAKCSPCEAGSFAGAGAMSCSDCPDKKVSAAGAAACSDCPRGPAFVYPNKCAAQPPCKPGTAGPPGACVPCSAYSIAASAGAASCTPCTCRGSLCWANAARTKCCTQGRPGTNC